MTLPNMRFFLKDMSVHENSEFVQGRPAEMASGMQIAGVFCEICGSQNLRIVAPGHEAERHDLIGLLERGERMRGWCGFKCHQISNTGKEE
jgi:hypothetical protein